jgi:hypothetical protein
LSVVSSINVSLELENILIFKDLSFFKVGFVKLIVVLESSDEFSFVHDNAVVDTVREDVV